MLHTGLLNMDPGITSQNTFASAIAKESSRLFIRLSHTPLVARQLSQESATGTYIEQFSFRTVHSLHDLEKVLCALTEYIDAQSGDAVLPYKPVAPQECPVPASSDKMENSVILDHRPVDVVTADTTHRHLPALQPVTACAHREGQPTQSMRMPACEYQHPFSVLSQRGRSTVSLPLELRSAFSFLKGSSFAGGPVKEALATSQPSPICVATRESDALETPETAVFRTRASGSPLSTLVLNNTSASDTTRGIRWDDHHTVAEPHGLPSTSIQRDHPGYSPANEKPVGIMTPEEQYGTSFSDGVPRDAVAPHELEGWLYLLAWVRCHLVLVLRGLAGVHSHVSRSITYWTWAQSHVGEASLVLALSSRSYWSNLFRVGFTKQHEHVRSRSMDSLAVLKALLHFVVSSLGAAYSALERLNALVASVQRACEMASSNVAAAMTAVTATPLTHPEGKPTPTYYYAADREGAAEGHESFRARVSPLEEIRAAVTVTIAHITTLVRPRGVNMESLSMDQDYWSEANLQQIGHGVAGFMEAMEQLKPSVSGNAFINEVTRHPVSSLEEGVKLLLHSVESSRHLIDHLNRFVQEVYVPPVARHWRRITIATLTIVPPFIWLYTKSPSQVVGLCRYAWETSWQVIQRWVVLPSKQMWDAILYVRPGVEERRKAFVREAESLADIIRDYHADYYPDHPQKELNDMRNRSLLHLSDGVADEEGYQLIVDHYRRAVRHPVRSLFFGNLLRLILIQMSYQELAVSRVTNGMDEVLEGNDLNFKVMAMVPVFASGALAVLWMYLKWRTKFLPVRRRMRVYWRSIHRVVNLAGAEPSRTSVHVPRSRQTGVPVSSPQFDANGSMFLYEVNGGGRGGASTMPPIPTQRALAAPLEENDNAMALGTFPGSEGRCMLSNYDQGVVLLFVHLMRVTAQEYFFRYSLFSELMEDLDDLESMRRTRHQRLETLHRMQCTHWFMK